MEVGMFGSYMLGFVGKLVALGGAVAVVLAIILAFNQNSGGATVAGIIAIAAIVGGGYMQYLSQHSVRSFAAQQPQKTAER
jgi:uncharacterized membrane protein YebE (DUF533 family)